MLSAATATGNIRYYYLDICDGIEAFEQVFSSFERSMNETMFSVDNFEEQN